MDTCRLCLCKTIVKQWLSDKFFEVVIKDNPEYLKAFLYDEQEIYSNIAEFEDSYEIGANGNGFF